MENNEAALKEQVSVDLNLNSGDITCNYVTSRVQEKYSVSHQETRVYNHRLYEMYLIIFLMNLEKIILK